MRDFFHPYRITWIVIGCILGIKAVAAVIYFCCCRKRRNRNAADRHNPTNVGMGAPVQCLPPYPSNFTTQCPPSYDDLVKDGIINHSFDGMEYCASPPYSPAGEPQSSTMPSASPASPMGTSSTIVQLPSCGIPNQQDSPVSTGHDVGGMSPTALPQQPATIAPPSTPPPSYQYNAVSATDNTNISNTSAEAHT